MTDIEIYYLIGEYIMTRKRLAKALVNVLEALTLISAFSLLLAFIFAFDEKLGYFDFSAKSSFPCYSFMICYALGFLTTIAMGFSTSKKLIIKTPSTFQGTHNSTAIAGTCAILFGALSIILNNASTVDSASTMIGAGAISFGAYCLLVTTNIGEKANIAKIITLLGFALTPLGMNLGNNSNYYRSINSVENSLSIIFGITSLIYILFEGKSISSDNHSRWHVPAALLAEHCGITLSTAYMLAYLLDAVFEPWRFVQMTIVLCISIAISSRRKQLLKLAQAKTEDEWQEYYDSLIEIDVVEGEEINQPLLENPDEPVEEKIEQIVEQITEDVLEENTDNVQDEIEEQKETDD